MCGTYYSFLIYLYFSFKQEKFNRCEIQFFTENFRCASSEFFFGGEGGGKAVTNFLIGKYYFEVRSRGASIFFLERGLHNAESHVRETLLGKSIKKN